jgi:hypothetical protein
LSGSAEDILAVGVEAHVPEADGRHKLLRRIQLTITAKDRVDKFGAGILAQLGRLLPLLLTRLQHGGLTGLEELLELVGETVARLNKVIDHLFVLLRADTGHALFGALHLASKLDQEEPELTGNVGDGGRGAVMVDGPVIDPLTQTVGIEDAAQEHDGFLGWVPVLEGVSGWDAMLARVGLGGLGDRDRRLLGHGGWARCLRSQGGALWGRGGLAPSSGEFVVPVDGRRIEVFAIICWTLCLSIVVLISAMPMIMIETLSPLCRATTVLAVDLTLAQIVYIFIFVLVAVPMRGSIRVRIPPLMTGRGPRTMFATHIGSSSGVVSAGVKSG